MHVPKPASKAQQDIFDRHIAHKISLREAMNLLRFKNNYNRFYRMYYHHLHNQTNTTHEYINQKSRTHTS